MQINQSQDSSKKGNDAPVSNIQRLDSAEVQKVTPAHSPLLKDRGLIQSRQLEPLQLNPPQVTPFQGTLTSKKKIQFEEINSPKCLKTPMSKDPIPYEKYHRNGNVSLHFLKLPQASTFSEKFPRYFAGVMFVLFPVGILLAFLSSELDRLSFTFVNCWLMVAAFTMAFIQQLIIQKNGLCVYILTKQELKYWNEGKFVKILWAIRVGLLVINLSLTIYFGFTVWDGNISESIISIFIFLSILAFIDLFCILVIVYAIMPVTNKQMQNIKERVGRLLKAQNNTQLPLSYQFMNKLLGVYQHGTQGTIYQGIVASQNYQKFLLEMEERQRELLVIARARNDKLSHEASQFINQLTNQLRSKKDSQANHARVINPGLAPFDMLVIYLSFYLVYCIGYPILVYFALLFQDIDPTYLPLVYFAFPLVILIWKFITMSFFDMKQFFDYNYEAKLLLLGVSAYRVAAMSVQSFSSSYYVELLLIKFSCKILGFWIEVLGYNSKLEANKQVLMSYIRGSAVDMKEAQNKLETKTSNVPNQYSQLARKRTSVYEPADNESSSFQKTALNWQHVQNLDNIKRSLITKQTYSLVILEISELVFGILFIIMSQILYDPTTSNYRWSTFNVNESDHFTFQLEIGIELILECVFFIITMILLNSTKASQLTNQLSSILGIDGIKALVYDYCFALIVCFLVVGNRFQVY